MKVTGYGTIRPPTTTRRRDGITGTGAFADVLAAAQAEGAIHSSAAGDITATGAIGNLLALQEISEEEKRRERLMRQGKEMLDTLERLRAQLLMGEIPAHMLQELAMRLQEERQDVADPKLIAIMEDIELRVAVELAKLEMSFASRSEM